MQGRTPNPRRCLLLSAAHAILKRIAQERGGALIEVMASAVLLVIVSVGVLSAVDGAAANSGSNKSRGIASSLAQQEQERLRTVRASDLSNFRQTSTKTVDGVQYTLTTRADWISDATSTTSCTSGTARADYLKIATTVTWPRMGQVKPVQLESIAAPPNGSFSATQGSLAVQVINRAGAAVPNLSVSLSGPPSVSDTTNSLGCVFYGYLPAGSGYRIGFSKSGWVTKDGVNVVDVPASVVAESVTPMSIDYDLAGQVNVSFQTKVGGVFQADQGERVTLANSGVAAGKRLFGTAGTPSTSILADKLFPFTGAYSVYSGDCNSAKPELYGSLPATTPAPLQSVNPGGAYNVTVIEPAMNVTVRNASLVPLANARVRITAKSGDCFGRVYTFTTNSQGKLTNPGLPYGSYEVCADNGSRKTIVTGKNNYTDAGVAAFNVDILTKSPSTAGTCP